MSSKGYFLISLILTIVYEYSDKSVASEWVEIPQFSDDDKVYRVPLTKYEYSEKFSIKNPGPPTIHSFSNTSAVDDGFRKMNIFTNPTIEKIPKPTLSDRNLLPISVTTETVYKFENTGATLAPIPQKNQDFLEPYEEETATVDVEDEEITVPTTSDSDENDNHKDKPSKTVPRANHPQKNEKPQVEDESKINFLAYMPVELFKKVHATLLAQPPTIKGKLGFLKRFEITLLAEIEKRLIPVMSPVRRKRDSRGDHGWEEHDEHVGFPSLEGALLAISFLTFAVYLVQLVMMLFRNWGNQLNMPATPTVLVNRNRRSVEELTEDTARVFDYLDKFAKAQYTDY